MTLFPKNTTEENKNRMLGLAKQVLNKDEKNISKDDLMFLMKVDMATSYNKLAVSAASTRPTDIKFATNNYYALIDIDMSGVKEVVMAEVTSAPVDDMINVYFEKKTAVLNIIKIKYEGTENFLRDLLTIAMNKDGVPVIERK